MIQSNRLLLLWQAAVTLEGSELDKKIMDARKKRFQNLKLIKNGCEKSIPNTNVILKNSHNEVERSRRAHLRNCMEELKKKLVFNSDCHLNRITMLHILRRATSTIKSKEKSIRNLYKKECEVKTQNAQLKQRLMYMEKQQQLLSDKYSMFMERRNRNFSECSINTTSSEESQLDDRLHMKSIQLHRLNVIKTENQLKSMVVSKCNSPISTGSDSGFDDLSNTVDHKYPKTISLNKPINIF